MNYATAPIAADFDLREVFKSIVCGAAASLKAALDRENERRGYLQLLERDDDYLCDIGVTRQQVRQALANL